MSVFPPMPHAPPGVVAILMWGESCRFDGFDVVMVVFMLGFAVAMAIVSDLVKASPVSNDALNAAQSTTCCLEKNQC